MKFLLIDDDKELTSMLKLELEDQNFSVDIAYDSIVGEKLALAEKYDLIILDIIMPGIDGFELCKKIRNKIVTPILIITSLNMNEDKVKWVSSGANDYLKKPFSINKLLSRINSMSLANIM